MNSEPKEKRELSRFKLLHLHGEVTDENTRDVVSALLKESKREVLLTVNSPGGSVDAGRAVVDAIGWCKTPVYTLATGGCYSMAFQIALYGKLRFCTPYATFMYHDTKYDFSYYSHPQEVNEVVQIQKLQDKQLTEDMLRLTKLDKKTVLENFKNRKNVYLSSAEALKLGVVDYVVQNEEQLTKIVDGGQRVKTTKNKKRTNA